MLDNKCLLTFSKNLDNKKNICNSYSNWKNSYFCYSQKKIITVGILRNPTASEVTLPWSFNPQSCFYFQQGRLFSHLFFMNNSVINNRQKSFKDLSFWSNFIISSLNFDRKRVSINQFSGTLRCTVSNPNDLLFVIQFFRDFSCCRFKNFCDIICVDQPKQDQRFKLV